MKSNCLTSTNEHNSELFNKQLDDCFAKIALGDKNALAKAYELTKANVYGYSLSVLKNPSDAEDVLQDVYVQLFRNAKNYISKEKPMAYLITITRNLCLMKIRRDKNQSGISQDEWDKYLDNNENVLPDEKLILKGYLSLLSPKEREIVSLYAIWSFKHKEISQMLEIPLSTVLSKYSRAIKKLRKYFDEAED